MSRKALRVNVNLEIQAVTCPGVWLCPSGTTQLLFSMLGQEIQTRRLPPVFPLLFHEKLTFEKTYASAGCLAEVQNALGQEDVYAVLLQETENNGFETVVQLARFHSTALNILYPSPCSKGLLAGVDIDLLMEPSADFPGILSPKIELSTKTIIEEITNLKPEGFIINPKTLCSQKKPVFGSRIPHSNVQTVRSDIRQRKQNSKYTEHMKDRIGGQKTRQFLQVGNDQSQCPSSFHSQHEFGDLCYCENGHLPSNCPLCTHYKALFSSMPDFQDKVHNQEKSDAVSTRKNSPENHIENTRRLSTALHSHVDRVLEPAANNIYITAKQPLFHCGCSRDRRTHTPLSCTERNSQLEFEGKTDPNFEDHKYSPKVFSSLPESRVSCGDGSNLNSSRQLFYANLEKFYRKLYARAKSRAAAETNLGVN